MKYASIVMTIFLIVLIATGCAGRAGLSQPPNSDEKLAAQKCGCPIAFSTTHAERNTANGIDVMITWKNISDKTIKYCYMEAYLKNAVGDRVVGEIRGKKSVILQYTGTYKPGKTHWGGLSVHPAAIYHPNAKSVHIEKVWVEFMDGTKINPVLVDGMISSYGPIGSKIY
ncbi:MAG: hypothetical protein KAI50_14305 [Desulfobacterales bacterium]|nr:hypothetical protein [Desulfobacterales bacterium]